MAKSELEKMRDTVKRMKTFESKLTNGQRQLLRKGRDYQRILDKIDKYQKEVMDCIANGYLECDEKKMDELVVSVVKVINDFIDKDENKNNNSSSQKGKNEEIVEAKVGSTTTNSAPQYAQPAQQVTNNVGASAGYNSGQAAANSQPNLQGQTPNYSQTGYTQPTTLQYDAQ